VFRGGNYRGEQEKEVEEMATRRIKGKGGGEIWVKFYWSDSNEGGDMGAVRGSIKIVSGWGDSEKEEIRIERGFGVVQKGPKR